jgi:hypothetical protein
MRFGFAPIRGSNPRASALTSGFPQGIVSEEPLSIPSEAPVVRVHGDETSAYSVGLTLAEEFARGILDLVAEARSR